MLFLGFFASNPMDPHVLVVNDGSIPCTLSAGGLIGTVSTVVNVDEPTPRFAGGKPSDWCRGYRRCH